MGKDLVNSRLDVRLGLDLVEGVLGQVQDLVDRQILDEVHGVFIEWGPGVAEHAGIDTPPPLDRSMDLCAAMPSPRFAVSPAPAPPGFRVQMKVQDAGK